MLKSTPPPAIFCVNLASLFNCNSIVHVNVCNVVSDRYRVNLFVENSPQNCIIVQFQLKTDLMFLYSFVFHLANLAINLTAKQIGNENR